MNNEIRCYKCNKKLVEDIQGNDWTLMLTCPRCKCKQELRHTDLMDTVQPISISA